MQELTEKNAQLLVVLDAKDKEIGRLEELVVAMEPVPGLDVESLMAAQKDVRGWRTTKRPLPCV